MNAVPEAKYSINPLPSDGWEARFTKQVARSVAFHKDSLGITTEELAARCGEFLNEPGAVKASTLNGLFAGKRKSIGIAEVFMFATALEVPVMSLLVPLGIVDDVEVRPGMPLSAARTVRTINGVESWHIPGNPLHMRFEDGRTGGSLAPERVMEQFHAEDEFYASIASVMESLRIGAPSAVIETRIEWVQGSLRTYQYHTGELVRLEIAPPPLKQAFAWGSSLKPEQFSRKFAERFSLEYEEERKKLMEAGGVGVSSS